MKIFTLTYFLIVTLLLSANIASAETATDLRALIFAKETELDRVQNELSSLRKEFSTKTNFHSTTWTTHRVKAGDTVSSIARRHKMSYTSLVKLNKLTDPSKIVIGQDLKVGSALTPALQFKKTAVPAENSSTLKKDTHVVKRGETFYRVAMTNSISAGRLIELNPGVDTDRIVVGQKLKISGAPASPIATPARSSNAASTKRSFVTTKKRVPKSSPTASLTHSTSNKPVSRPASSRKVSVSKKPSVKKAIATISTPLEIKEAPVSTATKKLASIILTSETSFSKFATKHGTTTESLNALNGWSLPKATILARGSEIYVPE